MQRTAIGCALYLASCGRTPTQWFDGREPVEDDVQEWLVTIDTNDYRLLRVDPQDGTTRQLCELSRDGARYTSSSFAPSGQLFVTYRVESSDTAPERLARLDPCTCEVDVIAEYPHGGVSALAWTDDDTLFAVSNATDELLELDPDSGALWAVGSAQVDIRTNGASWSPSAGAVLVLDGGADILHRLDPDSGSASTIAALDFDFGTLGFEVGPRSGHMFACTDDAVLYAVDPDDYTVSEVGPFDQAGNCGNLSAVAGPVECVTD